MNVTHDNVLSFMLSSCLRYFIIDAKIFEYEKYIGNHRPRIYLKDQIRPLTPASAKNLFMMSPNLEAILNLHSDDHSFLIIKPCVLGLVKKL